jgi:hypothetical protein
MENIDQSLTSNITTKEMFDDIKRKMFQCFGIRLKQLPDIST